MPGRDFSMMAKLCLMQGAYGGRLYWMVDVTGSRARITSLIAARALERSDTADVGRRRALAAEKTPVVRFGGRNLIPGKDGDCD